MKSNQRTLLLLPALAVAAWLALFGDKTPVDEAQTTPDAAVLPTEDTADPVVAQPRQIPRVRAVIERALTTTEIKPTDANPFGAGVKQESASASEAVAAVAAPDVQAFPYAFIGKIFDGKHWRVFLDKNDATLVVGVGAVIDDVFKVTSIKPPEMKVLEIKSKHEFTVQIEEAQ